jgi:nucleoside-diphosphate-sugar epimerase
MKHFVTGARGFLGKYLVQNLRDQAPNENVLSVDRTLCDLTDKHQVAKLIREFRPDRVYHLAGSPRITKSISMPEYFSKNFVTTVNLIESCAALKSKVSFFFASSVHVYGNQRDTVDENAPARPINFYGFTKYLAEEALRDFVSSHDNLSVVAGRLYTCLGPGQNEGFVAADFCRKIHTLKSNETLKVGPLHGHRTFLDVRDAVNIIPRLMSATQSSRFEIINIASPFDLEIGRVLEILLTIAKKKPRVESSQDATGNLFMGLKTNSQKLENLLSPLNFRPIETTLRDMYEEVSKRGP